MEKFKATVIEDKVIGYLEKGVYTGTRVLPNGRTAKVTVNDCVANGSLTPPPDIDDPILIGKTIREDQHYSEDNRARIIEVGTRFRTYESIEYCDSYAKEDLATIPDKRGTPPKA
jgi:hypothetical protein